MKKYLLTSLAVLSIVLSFGQGNYVNGNIGVWGPQWNAATSIATGGSVYVRSAIGNYFFGGIVSDRSSGVILFEDPAVYTNASATNYVNGTADYYGTPNFTLPVGDAGATVGGVYHPFSLSAITSNANMGVQYNASTSTPFSTQLAPGVGKVDPIASWATGGVATATITLATRDLTGVLGGNVYVAGYNPSTSVWEKIGVATAIVVGGQNLVSNAGIVLSNYTAFTAAGDAPSLLVNLKVFLQGAYTSGSLMRNDLVTGVNANSVNMIPLTQPYGTINYSSLAANGTYSGTEHVTAFPTTAVDWVLVQLRSTAGGAVVATRAGILLQNGTIVDTTAGFASPLSFPGTPAGNYYVVIRHRNNLGVMSANALALSSTVTNYDFTTSNNKAYSGAGTDGNNTPMVLLASGLYGMWGGDANHDGQVYYFNTGNDPDAILNTFLFGNANNGYNNNYEGGDVNMDGQTYYVNTGNDKDWILNFPLAGNANNGYVDEQIP